ncbi:MAG TPA: periplasmic heavy metal sensor, partial [Terriglobales bacterium]|nr:periplasmic heavy metal sensor [Terriglobales bacterium]
PPPGTPHARGGDVFYVRTNRPGDLGAWWKDSEIVRQLQLSDAQIKQIEETFLNARLDLIKMRADVEIQETILQSLVDADQMDEGKISAQIDQVLATRARLEKANTMMMLDIRKVLTVEQWKKLRAIQQSREQEHRMAPPARPGMPGPPQAPGPATAPPPPGDDNL